MCIPSSFKTEVDIDIFLKHDKDKSLETKTIILEWSLELEVRKFGIKSFVVVVPDQKIEVDFTEYRENSDEDVITTETVMVKNVSVDMSESKSLYGLSPKSLIFHDNEWKLEF
jgi:hypothetical protein